MGPRPTPVSLPLRREWPSDAAARHHKGTDRLRTDCPCSTTHACTPHFEHDLCPNFPCRRRSFAQKVLIFAAVAFVAVFMAAILAAQSLSRHS